MDNVLPVMNSVQRVLVLTGVDVVVGVTSAVTVLAAGPGALGV